MNKLRRIKFIPFERLCNVNSAVWINTSFELAKDSPFSEKFKISYDDATTRITSKPLDKGSSYKDILNSVINELKANGVSLHKAYAFEFDAKLNKGVDLFKNIVFIPARLRHKNLFLYSFYILQL